MKEAIVYPNGTVKIQDAEIPKPGPDEVLVKVHAFGTNPKDWKVPEWSDKESNSGDDFAGIVEAVGDGVFEFKKGDRVAGFHVITKPGGAFADYAISPSNTTFLIPESTSFEEAATVPLTAFTAACALFYYLGLPGPWTRKEEGRQYPLIIYGASTTIGAFGIKLASAAELHPIIAVGSANSRFIEEYLDPEKGDTLVDYTKYDTPESLAEAIKDAVKKTGVPDGRAFYGFDAVSESPTFDKVLSPVLAGPPQEGTGQKPRITVVLPKTDYSTIDKSIEVIYTSVGGVHSDGLALKNFGALFGRLFARGLQEGWLKPHPHELIPGGFGGLEEALKKLKENKVRGKKLVGRPSET